MHEIRAAAGIRASGARAPTPTLGRWKPASDKFQQDRQSVAFGSM